MRLSTGIILSILSTNAFAIEHLNDAHPSSLLARRAVVADADGPSLQKRTNDEDQKKQEEQANPDTGEGPTDSHTYGPNQGDADKNGRGNVYTGLDSDQGRSSLCDALGDSPSQVLGHIKNRLSSKKKDLGLSFSKQKAAAASRGVRLHFIGKGGDKIREELYALLLLALETSHSYKVLYKDSVNSPFILELPTSTPSGSRKIYKDLQHEVQQSIRNHISDIKHAIGYITAEPVHLPHWLKELMKKTDLFCQSISNMGSKYLSLLKDLGISDGGHIKDLDRHIKALEAYKCRFSGYFSRIKEMVEDPIKTSKQQGSSKSSSSTLESKGRPDIEENPSDDGASGSAQLKSEASGGAPSEDGASSSAQSEDGVVYDLVDLRL
ncbi:hypothetical protein BASA50_010223 [Batrachochytrium salamandrivorans]|uniref:Uncharacterized protein n=1 Tax=Batrachochytrium salamandrivorans TaxID=1357716 RepID=A0ABQ8EZM5_9FUNG|nr:hypothetical protein BASA50_010223 [Batrachochytrium salamandrivorans]